jgi:hypothetical protein
MHIGNGCVDPTSMGKEDGQYAMYCDGNEDGRYEYRRYIVHTSRKALQ